jgi:hypothetical protein
MGLMLFRQIPLQNSTCNKRLGTIPASRCSRLCLSNLILNCVLKLSILCCLLQQSSMFSFLSIIVWLYFFLKNLHFNFQQNDRFNNFSDLKILFLKFYFVTINRLFANFHLLLQKLYVLHELFPIKTGKMVPFHAKFNALLCEV